MKVKKKPITLEAFKWELGTEYTNWSKLPLWIQEAYEEGRLLILGDGLQIHTLEGWVECALGDWIIRGVKNEIYPCRSDIFSLVYDPA